MNKIRIRLALPPEGETDGWRLAWEIARRASQELGDRVELARPPQVTPGWRLKMEFWVPPGVDTERARRVLQRLATLVAQGRLLLPPEEEEETAWVMGEEGESEESPSSPPEPRRGEGAERRAEGAGGEKGSPSEDADLPREVSPDDRARSGRGEKSIASSEEAEETSSEEEQGEGGAPTGGDGGGGGGGSGRGRGGADAATGPEGRPPGGGGEEGPAGGGEGSQGVWEGWIDQAPDLHGGGGPGGAVAIAPALGAPPARILTIRDWSVPDRAKEIQEILSQILGIANHPQGKAEDLPGGRWDPQKVAVRVAGWLRPLRPEDRRQEAGQVRLLIAPDVSNSMGTAGSAGLALATTAAKVLEGSVVIVVHDNGAPDEIWIPPEPPVRVTLNWRDRRAILSFWKRMVQKKRVSVAILVADAQGEEVFRLLARKGVQLFWLDPYGCRRIGLRFPRKFPPPHMLVGVYPVDPLSEAAVGEWRVLVDRVRYASGCGDLETILRALRRLALAG